ncbi:hypothetical protein C9J12_05415 [Photobacterium frigidiphilum]|uniref:HTH luxR-type domain-containing protein n=1 Tax=Photobacterium frigidiphilum TaxID=264736 RepID=A0A2T3JMB2_9GAMM|nr:LuxR C-terminal-related transcriptional regulator [Photobacterium frigidiphilum]PSU50176.1 hypothetical protein C9J12_05415 [Photobacterium frigidiphilum]
MNTYFKILLLAEKCIKNEVLANVMKNKLKNKIHYVHEEKELRRYQYECNLILMVDLSSLSTKLIEKIMPYQCGFNKSWRVILFNVGEKVDVELITHWKNCCGIFCTDISSTIMIDAIKKINDGEIWLPRSVMSELVTNYRAQSKPIEKEIIATTLKLTQREEDILKLLVSGDSNAKMADSLFVSESTIKTHLYNTFKKIEVKNRREARAWAERRFM